MEKYKEIQWIGYPGEARDASSYLAEFLLLDGKYIQVFKEFDIIVPQSREIYYNRVCDTPLKRRSSVKRADLVVITDHRLIPYAASYIPGRHGTSYIVGSTLPPDQNKYKLGFGENAREYENSDQPELFQTVNLEPGQFGETSRAGRIVTFYLPLIAAVARKLGNYSPESLVLGLHKWLSRHIEPEPAGAAVKVLETNLSPPVQPPQESLE